MLLTSAGRLKVPQRGSLGQPQLNQAQAAPSHLLSMAGQRHHTLLKRHVNPHQCDSPLQEGWGWHSAPG